MAFSGSGVAGKNVENELCAIDYPYIDDFLDVALLRCREIVIEQEKIGGH